MGKDVVLGLDLGGTNMRAAALSADGELLSTTRMATEADKGPPHVLDRMAACLKEALGTSGCSTRTMETILEWLKAGRLKLDGLCSRRVWTFEDSPEEFFTARDGVFKPVLSPWG